MSDPVYDAVKAGGEPEAILRQAARSGQYTELSGEDGHRVFRGPDLLLVHTVSGGLYAEETPGDGERDEGADRADPLDHPPWTDGIGGRTTVYAVTGGPPPVVREQVYGALDQARYLFDGRDAESERYVNRGAVRAEVRMYNHRIEIEEWGPVRVPAFDGIAALELRAVRMEPVAAEQ